MVAKDSGCRKRFSYFLELLAEPTLEQCGKNVNSILTCSGSGSSFVYFGKPVLF